MLETKLIGKLYDGGGNISPPLKMKTPDRLEFDLTSLPTAIGHTNSHAGHITELTYCLDLPEGRWDVDIELLPIAVPPRDVAQIKLITKQTGQTITSVPSGDNKVSANNQLGSLEIRISGKPKDETHYRHLSNIIARRSE